MTVTEGGSATFFVQLSNPFGASFQWLRNGTNIPGATTSACALNTVHLADNGSTFQCRAVNAIGTSNSFVATLTVTADTTRPAISSVQNFGDNTLITMGFSEPLDPVSSASATNYSLNNGASVLKATLLADGFTVVLKTTTLVWNTSYTITVNNVKDLAQTPNTILPNSQQSFVLTYTPVDVSQITGTNEPPGPCSRTTGLVISEIMYHPAPRTDGRNLEFIELYNSNPWPEDLTGYHIGGDVGYYFPTGTVIAARSYLIVAPKPADVQTVFGLTGVLGPLTNSTPGNLTNVLDNGGATIRLRDELGAVLLEVNYSDESPWPAAVDGAGHSLVLARPSYGEADPRAWSASDRIGGSPGTNDVSTTNPWRTVMINEVLTHTDPPQEDSVELFNYSASPVDLGGCYLTDHADTNRFRIPNGTTIPARGFLAYTATQLGFALNAAGDDFYVISSDGSRVIDVLRIGPQENGVAFGRYPDGAPEFRRLTSPTFGTANARPLASDVVINEIMYKPVSGSDADEFVEIFNRGTNAVALDKWRLRGGISYTFPVGATIASNAYLVVAKDATNLLATHPGLSPSVVLGNYSGKLGNSGDLITLDKPHGMKTTNDFGQLATNIIHIVVDQVQYGTGGRWGNWSGGGGSSLERVDARANGNLATTWADSDETSKSGWITVEFTGTLDNGAMANADQLQIMLQGAGECLIDNVEAVSSGGGNAVVNSTFDSDSSGWFCQGNHEDSHWEATGGYTGGCLHIIATDKGDTGANRIRTVLSQTLTQGSTATLRAKVKWLKGHPEILLRLHGNWLEATGDTIATRNLGSPGLRNTQYRANSGPAINGVSHWPVLPSATDSVIVTAQMDDPDGISQAVLKYRVDPAANFTPAQMTYRGAGLYTAVIPAQASGTRVAFYIEAFDGGTPMASSRFPNDAPVRECLVGFGEAPPTGTFGDYRLWLTQSNVTRWATREKLSQRLLDATFVYDGCRVVYNAGTHYSGSPFHAPGYNSPDGNACDYQVDLASDDMVLGSESLGLFTIGNLNSDPTFQAERDAFWIAHKLGTPYLNRRYIHLFFNGQQRFQVYEDGQQPSREVVSEFFKDDDNGDLHKIEDWFEFNDSGDNMLGNVDATLQKFVTTGGVKKTARYRWNWRPRGYGESSDAFTNLLALVDALNSSQPEPFRTHVLALMNVEEFMRVFALNRIVGNWDSYGYTRGKNMYAYKPDAGGWCLLPWDIDFVFSSGGNSTTDPLFGSNEPVMDSLRAFPEFQRAYWRAFQAAVNGPLVPATFAARVDPIDAALTANGVGTTLQPLKDYADQRRGYILTQLANVAANFTVNSTVTVSNGLGILQGTAPIDATTLTINGAPWAIRWTSVSNWIATVPLQNGSNYFSVVGLDTTGNVIAGESNAVIKIYSSVPPSPAGSVVFNEIQFNAALPGGEFVELFNTSTTNAFDLSGWTIHGLSYTFPNGANIGPRGFQVLAKNRVAFGNLYGAGILVADEFSGNLQSDGETLTLLQSNQTNVVDRVRYEAGSPWPATAPGMSLQLRDPTQDNSRVANWSTATASTNTSAPAWVYVSTNGNVSGSKIYLYLESAGDIYLDDVKLVAGTVPDVGVNVVTNGGFESSLTGTWNLTANFASSAISTAVKHNGNASLHLVATAAGSGNNNAIYQNITPAITTGQPYALSFWYLPTTNGGPLTVRLTLNVPQVTLNPAPPAVAPATPATPGATNAVFGSIAVFPTLWLNEVQADNISGPLDNFGQRDPWVELFNSGTNAIGLSGCYLSDSYTNLSRWAFPTNVSVPAGGFLLVWCDNQTNQSTATAPHANFRLASGSGQIALSRTVSNAVQILDYLTYNALPSNWSYGDMPDGQPFYRANMFQFTPGATNSAASPPITASINEWMADNTITLADPADNDYEDWFELYNPGTNTVDLGGYYLTDTLTDKTKFLVPNNGHYLIPPRGYLLVWADNESSQNNTNRADLHVNFALSKGGEAIGIFAADGTQIDAVTFGAQTSDVSQGRFQDGSANIVSFVIPTPRAANVLPNTPPILAAINDVEMIVGQTLVFTASATDTNVPAQTLAFSLGAGAPAAATINPATGQFQWTPASAPGTNTISVVVTDNGAPSLSATQTFHVIVFPLPSISVNFPAGQLQLSWPVGTLQEADDVTGPFNDVTDVSPYSPVMTAPKKFYRIRF
ncbi:MAG: lamin tail domain-containing protein [Verrucomicrobiota bacterium]